MKQPPSQLRRSREYRKRIRLEALTHYSGGAPRCACCGETSLEFLSFDHINGGGTAERKKTNGGAIAIRLKNAGYPDGYRVLCYNCNMAIGIYGYCPHSVQTESPTGATGEAPGAIRAGHARSLSPSADQGTGAIVVASEERSQTSLCADYRMVV